MVDLDIYQCPYFVKKKSNTVDSDQINEGMVQFCPNNTPLDQRQPQQINKCDEILIKHAPDAGSIT